MRKYQPIWNRLRDDKKVAVKVLPTATRRVVKAVIKEKDMDTVFKLENSNDRWWLNYKYTPSTMIMQFWLTQTFGFMPSFGDEEQIDVR